MQCGECADEANCDGGGCGYVGNIGNDGGKEKKNTTTTPLILQISQIPSQNIQLDKLLLIKAATLTTTVTVTTTPRIQHSPIIHLSIAVLAVGREPR